MSNSTTNPNGPGIRLAVGSQAIRGIETCKGVKFAGLACLAIIDTHSRQDVPYTSLACSARRKSTIFTFCICRGDDTHSHTPNGRLRVAKMSKV